MYVEVKESFNTKYPTWIIAYCVDTDSFFVTNERHFFWQYEKEFLSEENAIEYFENHVNEFIEKHNEIAKNVGGGRYNNYHIFLKNTERMYSKRSRD